MLPLLALLTAFTVAAFGGSVLNSVADARDRAALLSVGADARVEAEAALPAGLAGRLGQAPGVREVTEVGIDYQAKIQNGRQSLPLATVDPAGYAALAGRTGLGAFPAGELGRPDGAEGGSEDAVRPALASPRSPNGWAPTRSTCGWPTAPSPPCGSCWSATALRP